MKKNYFLGLAGLSMFYIALTAASGGVAANQNADRTGSPVSTAACNQCHSGGNFNASTTIKLLDSGNSEVTEYIPGDTYLLQMTINHTGASGFGIQSVALFDDNTTAGSWATIGSIVKLTSLNSRTYGEQTSTSASNVFEFEWVAPAVGSGDVTFYANGLAANGNSGTSGDELASGGSLSITEAVSSSVDQLGDKTFNMYPNPAQEFITIDGLAVEGEEINFYDLSGKIIKQITAVSSLEMIEVGHLAKGTYIVKTKSSVQRLVKH